MTEEIQDQETQEAETEGQGDPELEAKAREQGWRPEDEWKGNTDGWLPASDFVDRNERLQKRGDKILQAQLTKMTAKTTAEIAELKATIADLGDHLTRADRNAYQRAIRDLKAKADTAAEAGDSEAYKEAQREIEDTQKAAEAEAAAKAKARPKPAENLDEDPSYQGWLVDNPWYDADDEQHFDPEIAAYADAIAPQVAKIKADGKPLVGEKFYARIAKDVKRKFPDRFGGNARRQRPNAVEGSARATRPNGQGYADLPPEAKQACDRFVREKVWTDIKAKDDGDYAKQARARYCHDYYA